LKSASLFLVVVDGSPAASAAVDAGLDLAVELGAPVRFVHASSPLASGIDAGMIVVGSRGLGAVAGTVLGSVSQNLIRYAAQPVLVVHAPAA